ncbi:MAG: hypothetical protein CSA68_06365 [Rhodobacterales bacterium]|nr:MAG: hypothetical protein CSA68_06365 [Rhodobacterales bacterium]
MHHLIAQPSKLARLLPTVTLLLLLLCVPADAGRTLTLGIGESRDFGMQALHSGRPDVARAIARGLLQRDRNDLQALFMLSAAQTALGRGALAVKTGKRALSLAQTGADRFTAARLIAAGKAKSRKYIQSELWLRRALQYAPSPYHEKIAKRDFRLVKRTNPLRLNFIFGVAPTSNVNNGASTDLAWLFGLPFLLSSDAQALSGTEYNAGVKATYRLSQSVKHATDLGVMLYGKGYSLSRSAKRKAPNARAKNYAFFAAEIFGSHQRLYNDGRSMLSFSATLGQNWYGGDPLNRYLRLGVRQRQAMSPKVKREFGLEVEHQSPVGRGGNDITTLSLQGNLDIALQDKGKLILGLEGRRAISDSRSAEFDSVALKLDYWLGQPVWGTDVSFGLSAERRDYPFSVYNANGRQDTRLSAGVSFVFSKAQLFGFSPSIDLRVTRNKSNIGLYDTELFTTRLGLRSTF